KVYECLQRYLRNSPAPALDYASGLSLQVHLQIECLFIICCLESFSHDTVAQKDYEPVLPPMPDDLPDDEEATRIICLVKNKQPLGATIKRNEVSGEIFIARVIHGGLADRSGEPFLSAIILSQGTIMFKVIPITERPVHNQTMLYVRAMVDYSPQQDPAIPCADAGMSFRKGDVLEIVDQTDALWWQAKKLPSNTACAGLIPPPTCSNGQDFKSFSLRTELFNDQLCVFLNSGFRRSMRLCRRRSHSTTQPSCHTRCPSSCYSALNCPYEEVVRYQRHPQDKHRLIALIGTDKESYDGENNMIRMIIAPKGYEESGREYHFTSREIFDNMVYNNRFLEYGEYKGNLYGTSIESAREVLNSGKICFVDIEPNAVRTHELRAYVIYVKPPPLERLRETRREAFITTNYYVNRPFKDEDFQEIEESARKMESQYGQFFDHIIINEELQDACVELLAALRRRRTSHSRPGEWRHSRSAD
uniref:MAGUK p55 scaffold protein 4, like n=1 Tax=Labrus bergylta TaxID=56723 RepID=A0A3Q3LDV3_9LABR